MKRSANNNNNDDDDHDDDDNDDDNDDYVDVIPTTNMLVAASLGSIPRLMPISS